jgi:gelsolin
VDARHNAAETEKEFKGAGAKPGLEVWRVENRRSETDTPIFGVKRWPAKEYGQFYTGDSYIVLNTYLVKDPVTHKPTKKLGWDVHFWIGNESSQDEYGVAAYKTVELDDKLNDGAIQHRETQGHESALFKSYFPQGMHLLKGGMESGFRHVKPEEYVPRLFHVRQTGGAGGKAKIVRASEVAASARSLNQGDVFLLDAGLKIYTFIGSSANGFEKAKGAALAQNLASARGGACKVQPGLDADFWKVLKGSEKDVQPASENREVVTDAELNGEKLLLYKLSDASGHLQFTKVAEGKLDGKMLNSNDAFILDADIQVWIWVGKNASATEKSQVMKYATDYLKQHNRPLTTPITRIMDGQVHQIFSSLFVGGVGPGSSTATGAPPKPRNVFCAVM